jgi:hypothetical protein
MDGAEFAYITRTTPDFIEMITWMIITSGVNGDVGVLLEAYMI